MAFKFVKRITKLINLYRMELATPYHEYFQIRIANSTDANKAFQLRYDVYCKELGWEDPAKFPDGLEKDEYDAWSYHCLLLHRSSGHYAGTVRLVKTQADHPEQKIPMIAHCNENFWDGPLNPMNMEPGTYGEISRLALLKDFRKRNGEASTPDGQGKELFEWSQTERRRFPHIALALYLAAAAAGMGQGMQGVYAMMEPRLARHLRFAGIKFEQVGDPVNFRGIRAPYYISRASLVDHLLKPLRGLLKAIADDLDVDMEKEFH